MTQGDVEAVIASQGALIAALDAGDVAAIEAATAALSGVLAKMRSQGAMAAVNRDRVDHALRQSDAARTRVNYLTDHTRQRLDRLAARRGTVHPSVYTAHGRMAVFGQ